MTIQDAVAGLKDLTEFKAIVSFIKEQKESCLVDFMDYQHIDSPEKLARLSGEIAAFHRIITLLDEKDDRDPHQKFKNEHRALLNRWLDESDIEDMEMARIAMDDLNEWLGEDVLEFESEIELSDEDEEDG